MKNLISSLLILVSASLYAQSITAELGGAGFYAPSLSFEYLLQDDSLYYSNGTRFKLGVGYGDWASTQPMGVIRFGAQYVWGKRNNWELGAEAGIPLGEAVSDLNGPLLYPSFGFRFGGGYARGLFSLGPLIIPFEEGGLIFSGPVIIPFANAGINFSLF